MNGFKDLKTGHQKFFELDENNKNIIIIVIMVFLSSPKRDHVKLIDINL